MSRRSSGCGVSQSLASPGSPRGSPVTDSRLAGGPLSWPYAHFAVSPGPALHPSPSSSLRPADPPLPPARSPRRSHSLACAPALPGLVRLGSHTPVSASARLAVVPAAHIRRLPVKSHRRLPAPYLGAASSPACARSGTCPRFSRRASFCFVYFAIISRIRKELPTRAPFCFVSIPFCFVFPHDMPNH